MGCAILRYLLYGVVQTGVALVYVVQFLSHSVWLALNYLIH